MASRIFLLMVASLAIVQISMAGDPDILTDFITPANLGSALNGSFFTFTGVRVLVGAPPPLALKILKATLAEFLALNGQSVSYAVLQFPASTTNPPHMHPRASELIFFIDGSLQYNPNATKPAMEIYSFGSCNAGTISVSSTLFATGIDDNILAKSFKTDVATIQKLKAGLSPPEA